MIVEYSNSTYIESTNFTADSGGDNNNTNNENEFDSLRSFFTDKNENFNIIYTGLHTNKFNTKKNAKENEQLYWLSRFYWLLYNQFQMWNDFSFRLPAKGSTVEDEKDKLVFCHCAQNWTVLPQHVCFNFIGFTPNTNNIGQDGYLVV